MKNRIHSNQSMSFLLKDIITTFLRGSSIEHQIFAPNNLWSSILSDRQLHRLINCLVTNAVDALKNGDSALSIHASNIAIANANECPPLRKGEFIKIVIKDNGTGIPEDNLNKMFEPYFTTKPGGVGLGLAVARAIIEKNQGHITVKSRINVGSTFTVYLPAREAPQETLKKQRSPRGKGKILVMDREEIVRKFIGKTMSQLGYKVKLTNSCSEVLHLYEQAREIGSGFDVLILDLALSNDFRVPKILKKLLAIDPEVKAIVSSGYYNDPVIINHRSYGFKDALIKPYNLTEIFKVLSRTLGGDSMNQKRIKPLSPDSSFLDFLIFTFFCTGFCSFLVVSSGDIFRTEIFGVFRPFCFKLNKIRSRLFFRCRFLKVRS